MSVESIESKESEVSTKPVYPSKPHIIGGGPATEFWNAEPGTKLFREHEHNIVVDIKCRVTGKLYHIEVLARDFDNWIDGGYAQECFSYLTAPDRELLISGTSEEAWVRIFGDEMSEEVVAEEARTVARLHLRKEDNR